MSNYDDIINLNRPLSKHQRLSDDARAAQFAPFSALTGYDDEIKKTQRLTEKEIEIDDDVRENINKKLCYIKEHITDNNEINIIYFKKDDIKEGGKYISVRGIVKKIDSVNEIIKLYDDSIIYMKNIISIEGDIFDELDI